MKIIRSKKERRKDGLTPLAVMQTVLAVLIAAVVFLLSKTDGETFEKLRGEFEKIVSEDYDLAGKAKEFAKDVSGAEKTAVKTEEETAPAVFAAPMTYEPGEKAEPGASAFDFYDLSEAAVMPVNGKVTSPYGSRIHPVYGTESFHSGRDIAADEGTDILAALDGTVTAAGVGENSGNYIKIASEGGVVILYCHCSEVYAAVGQTVRKGDVIAAVGHTGLATGPHLHFEVRINGELTDPAVVLDTAVIVDQTAIR